MGTEVDLETITNEDYFDALNEMFNSLGWAVMLAELKDNADLINDVQSIEDEKDLRFRQGQLATIGLLMNFQSTIERSEAESEEYSDESA